MDTVFSPYHFSSYQTAPHVSRQGRTADQPHLNKLRPYNKNATAKYLPNIHVYEPTLCTYVHSTYIYAFRYMPHVIYLDTYKGLPYIPEYTHIPFSQVEALTNSIAFRRPAFHSVVLLESKSRSQTV